VGPRSVCAFDELCAGLNRRGDDSETACWTAVASATVCVAAPQPSTDASPKPVSSFDCLGVKIGRRDECSCRGWAAGDDEGRPDATPPSANIPPDVAPICCPRHQTAPHVFPAPSPPPGSLPCSPHPKFYLFYDTSNPFRYISLCLLRRAGRSSGTRSTCRATRTCSR
jgi:hypothetical protein